MDIRERIEAQAARVRRARSQSDREFRRLITLLREGREKGQSYRVLGEAAGFTPQRVEQLTREEGPK